MLYEVKKSGGSYVRVLRMMAPSVDVQSILLPYLESIRNTCNGSLLLALTVFRYCRVVAASDRTEPYNI